MNGCQSREKHKTERLRLHQNPQNRLGVLVSFWNYMHIVVMKIHYMSLPKIESRIWLVPTFGLIDRKTTKKRKSV